MQPLSIFDMDKTITRAATFGPFLIYAVPRYAPWRVVFAPLVLLTTLGFLLRIVSRGRLKEINLALMLGTRIDTAKLDRISAGFAGQTLSRNCLAGALARVEAERAAGRRVILATASYAFYVRQIAALIGVKDVIATRTTDMGGFVSPRIDGANCYGGAKLRMVQDWMAAEPIDRQTTHIRFFSDHVSDAPCLDWADEGFATNAHAPLRALALKKGWPVLDWA